jgi:hypothetical protein
MFIFFNMSGHMKFTGRDGESVCEASFRVMSSQLHPSLAANEPRVMDWSALDARIGPSPFVLFIDEIKILSRRIYEELNVVLKELFWGREESIPGYDDPLSLAKSAHCATRGR